MFEKALSRYGIPLALGFSLLGTSLAGAQTVNRTVELELLGESYRIELADTPAQRTIGLMHRASLAPKQGMLFVYPGPGDRRIWMKNTLIPLTVIWLDDAARIVGVKVLEPCTAAPCPAFGAGKHTRYVLELHASAWSRFKPGKQLPALLQFTTGS